MSQQRITALLLAAFAITTIGSTPVACQEKTARPMRVVRKFPLGGDGRWDYLTVDSQAKRLYIARATRFMVVSTETGELVGEIPDTPGAHGVAIATEMGLGFTSNGQANNVSVFDLKTLAVTKKIPAGQNPDAILYHAPTRSVFVFNGQSHSASVIDAASLTATATIPLAGKPEFAVADDHGNVYVNIADKNTITVIDAASRKVKRVLPLGSCEEPTGLSIDKSKGVVFASCGNQKLAVVDLSAGKVVQTVPIGDDCDATAFDPNAQLVFASNGEGSLTVIARDEHGSYHVQQTLATQPGSKTMALDSSSRQIYIPTGKFSGPPTQKPRPKLVPGTFEVWIISD
jgi:YVTN family beta-propeller protein